jgi:hypothetical protein
MQTSSPMRWPVIAAGAVAALAALAPQPGHAFRVTAQAAAVCQGALPSFEGAIRKRPLAVQNEGSTDAFVTCALNNPGYNAGTTFISSVEIYAQNLNSSTRSITCTAVNSSATTSPDAPLYATRTVNVAPSDTNSTLIEFAADDFPGSPVVLPGDTVSVSCKLVPGMGITGTVLVNNAS